MIKKSIFRIAVIFSLNMGILSAVDFWDDKPYEKWTPKEVNKVLSRSPWAQKVVVRLIGGASVGDLSKRVGSGGTGSLMQDTQSSNQGGFGNSGAGIGGRGAASGGLSGNDGRVQQPSLTTTIRWVSARPVKQALVKRRYGSEAGTASAALEYLAREEENYIISVVGLPALASGRLQSSPEKVTEVTSLRRKGREPIFSGDLQVSIAGDKSELFFSFPKSDSIALQDKEVEFLMKTDQMEIKKRFKLKKMLHEGELSL